jgi:hypothetical protein
LTSGIRKRRRKKPKDPTVPVIGWVVLGACLLILLAIPFVGSERHSKSSNEVTSANTASTNNPVELVVSASSRDPGCNCVRGVLKNPSGKAFNEVQIYFNMTDKNGADLGTVLALTGVVRPHSKVEFYTDRMPPAAVSYSLKEIK